jgi:hypothetical protein
MNGLKDLSLNNKNMTGSTEQEITGKVMVTDQLIDLTAVSMDSPIRELVKKLSVNRSSYGVEPKESIMGYEKLCTHDSAYLCECRLQYIVDFLINKTPSNEVYVVSDPEAGWDRIIGVYASIESLVKNLELPLELKTERDVDNYFNKLKDYARVVHKQKLV